MTHSVQTMVDIIDTAVNASPVSPLVAAIQAAKLVDTLNATYRDTKPGSSQAGARLDFQLAPFGQVELKPFQPAVTAIAFDYSMTNRHTCPCCSYVLLRHIRSSGLYWRCDHCYAEMSVWV